MERTRRIAVLADYIVNTTLNTSTKKNKKFDFFKQVDNQEKVQVCVSVCSQAY